MVIEYGAARTSGLPHEFVATLVEVCAAPFNNAVAIRLGQAPRAEEGDVTFKPIDIKTKTALPTMGGSIVAGFIPMDQNSFGREGSAAIPADSAYVQRHITMRELIDGINTSPPMYQIVGVDESSLIIEPTTENKLPDSQLQFQIDFSKAQDTPNVNLELIAPLLAQHSELTEPEWWNPSWGEFATIHQQQFSVNYRNQRTSDFAPLNLLAKDDKAVTADADILFVGMPPPSRFSDAGLLSTEDLAAQNYARLASYYQPVNAANTIEGIPTLLATVPQLNAGLYSSSTEIDISALIAFKEYLDDRSTELERGGMITPCEELFVITVNQQYATHVQGSDQLFKHGPESNNPGTPSPMSDVRMLHVWRGRQVITENEQELVDFVMQDDYLENNVVNVHPQWNMQLWSPVIEKQLALGYEPLLNLQTTANYHLHQAKVASPLRTLARRASATFDALVGRNSGRRSSHDAGSSRDPSPPSSGRRFSLGDAEPRNRATSAPAGPSSSTRRDVTPPNEGSRSASTDGATKTGTPLSTTPSIAEEANEVDAEEREESGTYKSPGPGGSSSGE